MPKPTLLAVYMVETDKIVAVTTGGEFFTESLVREMNNLPGCHVGVHAFCAIHPDDWRYWYEWRAAEEQNYQAKHKREENI